MSTLDKRCSICTAPIIPGRSGDTCRACKDAVVAENAKERPRRTIPRSLWSSWAKQPVVKEGQ